MSDVRVVIEQDWPQRARGYLPGQFQGLTGFEAWMTAIADSAATVENLYTEILYGTTLDLATGAQLDRWGSWVGQQRLGLTDSEYRDFIQARILANVTHGQLNDLIEIMRLVCGAIAVWAVPHYPATLSLQALVSGYMRDERRSAARRLLDDVQMVELRAVEVPIGFQPFAPDLDAAPSVFRIHGPEPLGSGLLPRLI